MNKNKGFAGLEDFVSDISDVPLTSGSGSDHTQPPVTPRRREAPGDASASSPPPLAAVTSDTSSNSGSSGRRGVGWVVGVLAVVILVIVSMGTDRKGKPSSESSNFVPTAGQSAISEYARAIPDLDPKIERSLLSMLDAAKAKDVKEIAIRAASIEKMNRPGTGDVKPQVKQARAQNAIGLKLLKEQRKGEAVSHFFAAYKANPRDTEVVQNFGEALYETGDYLAAKKAFYASLAITPKRWHAWTSLGRYFAQNNEPAKAASAFSLAFQFAKSPKAMRQSVLWLYRNDESLAVKDVAKSFLIETYSSAVHESLGPLLGNLAGVSIPVLLPSKITPTDSAGKTFEVIAVNNEIFEITATTDSYRIPLASEPNCRANYCAVGMISGRKVAATDIPEEGELVEVTSGVPGTIIRDNYRSTSKVVFRLKDVEYTVAMSADPQDDVVAARSAVQLGAIPTEVFADRSKLEPALMKRPPAAPTQPYIPPAPINIPSTQSYAPPPTTPPWGCNISYSVSLQTFGESVNVELRAGTPGASKVVSSSQSHGGAVRFDNLCAGNYFLAIGSGDSVSVTPVRFFESGVDYTSTLTMQRGSGNVFSRRKSDL